jgi:hypothetical protein
LHLFVIAGSGEDPRSHGQTSLYGEGADPSGSAMNKNDFPGCESGNVDDVGPHRTSSLGQRSRCDDVDIMWPLEELGGGNRHPLGIGSSGNQCADLIPDVPALHALANGVDRSGALDTKDAGQARRCAVGSLTLQEIGEVQRGRVNVDDNLAG